jgi:hypothetical protein
MIRLCLPLPPSSSQSPSATSLSKTTNPLSVAYYAYGRHNYALVIQANGTMQKGEYEARVAKDGHSLMFIRTICKRLFDKKFPKKS